MGSPCTSIASVLVLTKIASHAREHCKGQRRREVERTCRTTSANLQEGRSAYRCRLAHACLCVQPGVVQVCSALGPFQGRDSSLHHSSALCQRSGSHGLTIVETNWTFLCLHGLF